MTHRRDFLKTALAGAAAAGLGKLTAAETRAPAVAGIDRQALGKIGTPVSLLGLGLGSAFTQPYKNKVGEGQALLEQALEKGINYWDTCRGYGPSEEIIGPVVAKHRDKIFLVSKSGGRDYDSLMRDVETSLKNLKTDHLNILHMWNLKAKEDLDRMEKGCFKAVQKLKDEKVIHHYGITGHSGADVLCNALKRFHPDAMMTVFPCTRDDNGKYEDKLLPLAREQNVSVIAMKTVRHARGADLKGSDLIRYALSLDGIYCAVVGLDSLAHLNENVAMATNFTPFTKEEMTHLTRISTRVLANTQPPWEKPGYQDGALV
ncbi:aldo/keto reductase [Kiritimatiellaeota bacterium B1221]|nr:aldo/keto reductase [Kiritimatiellaeota bacterium B1221]